MQTKLKTFMTAAVAASVLSMTLPLSVGWGMTKNDLIDSVASNTGLSETEAKKALYGNRRSLTDIITKLNARNKVEIVNFGTFKVVNRNERLDRNPRTGGPIQIKASRLVKFSPVKERKELK